MKRFQPLIGLLLLLVPFGQVAAQTSSHIQHVGLRKEDARHDVVVVKNRALVQTTQLYSMETDVASAGKLLDSLTEILTFHKAQPHDVIKLNVYGENERARLRFADALRRWCGRHRAKFPATAFVATPLPRSHRLGIDAIFALPAKANPRTVGLAHISRSARKSLQATTATLPSGDLVYVSGQAEAGDLPGATRKTLAGLMRTLEYLKLDRTNIVQIKCFVAPMSKVHEAQQAIVDLFEGKLIPPVSFVEWKATSRPIEIEVVAAAPKAKTKATVTYPRVPWLKTSPVFSRVARLHGDTLIFTSGLTAAEATKAEGQVKEIFSQLRSSLKKVDSDLRHLAKATYYVSDTETSTALNRLRPSVYDPARPPAASKAMVADIGRAQRQIMLDIIAAPASGVSDTPDLSKLLFKKRIVEDTSTGDVRASRTMITGPGVNEHPPMRGCTGFVGWESVVRLKNGDLLCSFSAGYWHVSFPSPIDLKPSLLLQYQKSGFPKKVDAPTGGRGLICRSQDNGKTWSRPRTLVDTPGDDRHPVIVQLADGTLVCCFFVIDNWYGYDVPPTGRNKNSRVASIHSSDGGKTWSKPVFMPSPFKYYDRMCGKPIVLPNGDLLFATYGMDAWGSPVELGLYRSTDKARSWKFVSRLKASGKELDEPAICRARDGRIVMIARPEGEIAYSSNEGRSWSKPQKSGINMVAPCLLTLRDGTLVCIFGWGGTGGIQMMWSEDMGETWTVPAKDRGFKIDDSVYVYAIGEELADGSIYIVYYDPRGKQRKTAIWGVRVKIRGDRKGIDILKP